MGLRVDLRPVEVDGSGHGVSRLLWGSDGFMPPPRDFISGSHRFSMLAGIPAIRARRLFMQVAQRWPSPEPGSVNDDIVYRIGIPNLYRPPADRGFRRR
uniref:Uncharacterized protein n=1 Tax=Candidatus Kentrum eta TaxID=2126337 RepID=A0A450USU0_9GAMM|nr:MAG: hypothetical protein BECKH772A_GA0070896_100764 [Candidatus Kentron sp. H]VFJ95607.1 MAG: hypothetical protein BECKH772B_GA0070898_100784 [Candidatus Kentron sp. H]VFK01856.1 MAG: hypothetical protein BECKH772C_GA0070978_100744 [Candidatus Kentron sp. H]